MDTVSEAGPDPADPVDPADPTHEPEAAARAAAVHSVEALLAWFLGVVYNVVAVHYVLAPTEVLGAALRVLGALHVDAGALYLLVKGYSAGEYVARRGGVGGGRAHVRAVARLVVPPLVVSSVLYGVLQLMTCPACAWDWAAIGLSPVMCSAFADVRPVNIARGVNEVSWLVQAHAVLLAGAFEIHEHVKTGLAHSPHLPWLLAAAWLPSFAQAFLTPARFANVANRNVLANAPFFAGGVLASVAQTDPACKAALFALANRGMLAVAAAVAALAYVHHLDPYAEPAECVAAFGGTPCLWLLDSCSARLLPLHFAALLWLVDSDGSLPPSLGGPLAEPLAVTLRHVTTRLATFREYGPTWLLFGQFLATALHKILLVAAPGPVARFAYFAIPLEIAVVSAGGVLLRRVTAGPFAAAFDAVCRRAGLA